MRSLWRCWVERGTMISPNGLALGSFRVGSPTRPSRTTRGRESGLKFVTSLADLPCMAIGADPRPKRFRLLVVNGYEVAPLTSGGQRRIRDVYAALVPFLDVELVTLARNPLHGGIRGLAPGLVE